MFYSANKLHIDERDLDLNQFMDQYLSNTYDLKVNPSYNLIVNGINNLLPTNKVNKIYDLTYINIDNYFDFDKSDETLKVITYNKGFICFIPYILWSIYHYKASQLIKPIDETFVNNIFGIDKFHCYANLDLTTSKFDSVYMNINDKKDLLRYALKFAVYNFIERQILYTDDEKLMLGYQIQNGNCEAPYTVDLGWSNPFQNILLSDFSYKL